MNFEEAENINKKFLNERGEVLDEYQQDPGKIGKKISDNMWLQMYNFVRSDKNQRTIKNMGRFILLKQEDDDYMTKLDLIDTHRKYFIQNKDYPKLDVNEREKLRVLVLGNQRPYMSRKPENFNFDELTRLKDKMMPGFKELQKNEGAEIPK